MRFLPRYVDSTYYIDYVLPARMMRLASFNVTFDIFAWVGKMVIKLRNDSTICVVCVTILRTPAGIHNCGPNILIDGIDIID